MVVLPWSTWAMMARLCSRVTMSSRFRSRWSGVGEQELSQRPFRPGAEMRNGLGRGKGRITAAVGDREAAAITVKETRGIEIARPGGIHHPVHGSSLDHMGLRPGQ